MTSLLGQLRFTGALALAALAGSLASGCAGDEFTSGSGGSAGQGGSGGKGGTSGSGGSTGGSAGKGGSGGSGGSTGGSGGCDCQDGQYCAGSTCRDCDDFSSIEFAEPELLGTVGGNPDGSPSFPRVGDDRHDLFYSTTRLWYAPDASQSFGASISQSSASGQVAPLYFGNSGNLGYNFLFTEVSADTTRSIVTASWDGDTLTPSAQVPSPVNLDATDDYSQAFAVERQRFWWMSAREGQRALYTFEIGETGATRVDPELRGAGGMACPVTDDDITPWVTSDGQNLFFSALPRDSSCNPVSGAGTDLYAVLLDPSSGTFAQPAGALDEANGSGNSNETAPSLSEDFCTLYFASDRGGNGLQIYRAARQ